MELILDADLSKVLVNHEVRIQRVESWPQGCHFDDTWIVVVDDPNDLPPDIFDVDDGEPPPEDPGVCYIIAGTDECVDITPDGEVPCMDCTDVMGSPDWETSS